MISTINNTIYNAFGLHISSEIRLPEVPIASIMLNDVNVKIVLEDLTECWNQKGIEGKIVVVEEMVVFKVKNLAIFSIQEGKRVIVSPLSEWDENKTRLYLLGTCMGVILLQRGMIPLHGSAIVIDGRAYGIVGDSGVGKSTLTTAFIKSGYKFLSDDVIAVSLSEKNIPFVNPSYPQQKLWQDSLDVFGFDSQQFKPLFDRENKYAVPVEENFHSEPKPLAGIIELIKTEEEHMEVCQLSNLNKVHTLFKHTFRNFLVQRLSLLDWHFHHSTEIANQIQIHQLKRPLQGMTPEQLVHHVLTLFEEGRT
ncbi:aldolase [Rossellomorea vietnamensis]|uniref:Aldolase n=1 Tax=Rossellomorea vietnamensis TaxID=218284 RepID=A0ACD4C2K6_9BACI|nr:aldolase [Rossellomorea vietnamensis]UXH42748.1 aldolase [Rossellomorea vietnamensis]